MPRKQDRCSCCGRDEEDTSGIMLWYDGGICKECVDLCKTLFHERFAQHGHYRQPSRKELKNPISVVAAAGSENVTPLKRPPGVVAPDSKD
jgi:hypothetical protein